MSAVYWISGLSELEKPHWSAKKRVELEGISVASKIASSILKCPKHVQQFSKLDTNYHTFRLTQKLYEKLKWNYEWMIPKLIFERIQSNFLRFQSWNEKRKKSLCISASKFKHFRQFVCLNSLISNHFSYSISL